MKLDVNSKKGSRALGVTLRKLPLETKIVVLVSPIQRQFKILNGPFGFKSY